MKNIILEKMLKDCPVCGSSYQSKLEKAFDKSLEEICDLYQGEFNCQPCPGYKVNKGACRYALRIHYLKKGQEK